METRPQSSRLAPLVLVATLPAVGVGLWLAGGSAAVSLGVSLPLFAALGLTWGAGVRYPDVGWLILVVAALGLDASFKLGAEAGLISPAWQAGSLLMLEVALAAFVLAFFRIGPPVRRSEVFFGIAVVVYTMVCLTLPLEVVERLRLVSRGPAAAGGLLMGLSVWRGVRLLGVLPTRRRWFVASLTLVALLYGAARLYLATRSESAVALAMTATLQQVMVTALLVFLLADLMVFHRGYYRSKSGRTAGGDLAELKRARFELGRAVRDLLLPPTGSGVLGGFRYELVHRPSPVMGGDWIYLWTRPEEHCLLIGDVEGSGPQAALGVAAVISLLHEAQGRGMTLLEAARLVNQRLLEIFNRQLTTTLQAVSMGRDGTVEILNAGGSGFFAVSRDGIRHQPLPGMPLGVTDDPEIAVEPIPMEDGAVLFAATDGVINGQDGTQRLLDHFDEAVDGVPTLVGVKDIVMGLGPAVEDDRTMVLIWRQAETDLEADAPREAVS